MSTVIRAGNILAQACPVFVSDHIILYRYTIAKVTTLTLFLLVSIVS